MQAPTPHRQATDPRWTSSLNGPIRRSTARFQKNRSRTSLPWNDVTVSYKPRDSKRNQRETGCTRPQGNRAHQWTSQHHSQLPEIRPPQEVVRLGRRDRTRVAKDGKEESSTAEKQHLFQWRRDVGIRLPSRIQVSMWCLHNRWKRYYVAIYATPSKPGWGSFDSASDVKTLAFSVMRAHWGRILPLSRSASSAMPRMMI